MAKLDLHSTAGLVRYATTSSSPEYGSGVGGWGEGWGPRPRAGSVSGSGLARGKPATATLRPHRLRRFSSGMTLPSFFGSVT
jgi:hypothetical protein